MEKEEFIKKAKEMGLDDDYINETIINYEESIKKGINPIPLELCLFEPPVQK